MRLGQSVPFRRSGRLRVMNTVIDLGRLHRNMDAVCEYARIPPEAASRRVRYFSALNRLQKYQFPYQADIAEPLVEYEFDRCRSILESLMRSDEMLNSPDVQPLPSAEWHTIGERFRAALQMLDDYDADVAAGCRSLLAAIVMLQKDGYVAGSFCHILGFAWFSPTAAWTPVDYAEHLLHESVHQAMFLDDMVNSLFSVLPGELASDAARVTSSIRCVPRPYDFSFHAATVSVALIQFFEHVGRRERSKALCAPLLGTLVELADRRQLLSVRGGQILCDMFAAVEQSETFREVVGRP